MKWLKLFWRSYQAVIVVLSLLFLYMLYLSISRGSLLHWRNIILCLVVILPAGLLCLADLLLLFTKTALPKFIAGVKNAAVSVFTVLWTGLFGYLLIFQSGSSTACGPIDADGCGHNMHITVGAAPGPFEAADTQGNPLTLGGSSDGPLLIDFWGVWCRPCQKGLPHTDELYRKYRGQGLRAAAVHTDFQQEGMTEFLTENDITLPVVIDDTSLVQAFGVHYYPTYFLLDKSGTIVYGPRPSPPPEKTIQAYLK